MSVWIVASALLGRPVDAAETYPHICGLGGRWRRDCAACLVEATVPPTRQPLDGEAAALAAAVDARRTGERE